MTKITKTRHKRPYKRDGLWFLAGYAMIENMINSERFLTTSLAKLPEGLKVARILAASIEAVNPGNAVRRYVRRDGSLLWVDDKVYDLDSFKRVFLIGAGKASLAMALAIEELVKDHLSASAIITKTNYRKMWGEKILELPGGHPLPDATSLESTRQMLELVDHLEPTDLVLCMVSGGGSALMTAPVEGVGLPDLQKLTSLLLRCGATINEINAIRKHVDRVKGGGLAKIIYPAQLVTLILSDVIGSPLEVIASGPTVADPTTYAVAEQVLSQYAIEPETPGCILQTLQAGKAGLLPESAKPGDRYLERVHNVIVGSNLLAAEAGVNQACLEGLNALLLTTYLQGPARLTGCFLSSILKQMVETGQPVPRPACLVAGGETTVVLKGSGKGGRNQEMALSSVESLNRVERAVMITLATDGEDGPTDAAGAVVTGETAARASDLGLSPQAYLEENDSYAFFNQLGDLVVTGSTGTNVNDLVFLFAF
jgi:glycerate 2-kinase